MNTCDNFDSIADGMMQPSSYTSLIKFYGRSILPPLLTAERRQEMSEYRRQAVLAETRLRRRKHEKSNLVNKVQAVADRIEKFHLTTCSSYPIVPITCWEENQTNKTVPINTTTSTATLECDVHRNKQCTNLVDSTRIDEVDFTSEELQLDRVEKFTLSEVSTKKGAHHKHTHSNDADFQSSREVRKEMVGDLVSLTQLSCPATLSPEPKSCSLSDLSNNSYQSSPGNSEDNDTDHTETVQPIVINDFSKPSSINKCDTSAQDHCSSPDQRTSEIEDGECNSTATVILRISNENASLEETDTESIPASVAQSTDLERYMDSSADITGSSHGQSDNYKETSTESSNCPSSISDACSSRTLIASKERSLSQDDIFHMVSSSTSPDEAERNFSLILDTIQKNKTLNISLHDQVSLDLHKLDKGHVRRSSYTLDQPSLALIRVHEGCSCHGSPVGEKIFPHTSSIEYNDNINNNDIPQLEAQELISSQHTVGEGGVESSAEKQEVLPTPKQHLSEEIPLSSSEVVGSEEVSAISVLSFAEKQISMLEEKQKQLKSYLRELAATSVPAHKSKFTKSFSLNSFQEPFEETVSEPRNDADFKNITDTITYVDGRGDYNELQLKKNSNITEEQILEKKNLNLSSHLPSDMIAESSKEKDYIINNIHQHLQDYHDNQIKALIEEQRQQWRHLQEEVEQQLCHQLKMVASAGGFSNFNADVGDTARMAKVSSAISLPSQKNPVRISPEALHPSMKPNFDRVSAAVKGYLTRRLMKTERVQSIIQTIKDTLECAVKLHQETPIRKGVVSGQDVELHQRLLSQLTASCYELHDIFFTLSIKERMSIIAKSRTILLEKKQKDSSLRPSQLSSRQRQLSTATLKAIERKRAKSSLESGGSSLLVNYSRTKRSPVRPGTKGFPQRRSALAIDRPRTAPPSIRSSRNPCQVNKTQKNVHKTEPSSKMMSKKPCRSVRRALYLENYQEAAAQKESSGVTFS